jgi:predicted Zn-dependent peptidase
VTAPKRTRGGHQLSDNFDVREARLANGLKIRLLPDNDAPIASVYTFFRVGSRNEQPGITGISHLFEHMMFNGAKKYGPKQFDRVLEAHGGRSNAYTTNDITVYHEDFASDALEKVFDLESDRMRSLRINQQVLDSEREVVKEERRLRVENEILGLLDEELGTLVWKAHPYRWPVIGWMGDINNISKSDCDRFFKAFYAPNNATLYVVGDFEPRSALKMIQRYYADIPSGPAVAPVVDSEPEQKGERRALIRHPAQAPSLMIGFRAPAAKSPDALTLDVLQYLLSVGEGSRLMRELVYRRSLAASIFMDWSWRIDPGALVFYLELNPGSNPERVEQALYAELAKVAEKGVSKAEHTRAVNNLRAHQLRELATNSGRAHAMGTYEVLLGSWREGLRLPARYGEVTIQQLREAAARYFAPDRRSVVRLEPSPGSPS